MGRPITPRFTESDALIGFAALHIAALKVGGPRRLCAKLGIGAHTIAQWKHHNQPLPMHLVPVVVDIAQSPLVTPYTLRPDLWYAWARLGCQLADCSCRTSHESPAVRADDPVTPCTLA